MTLFPTWLRAYERGHLGPDVAAGVTIAAMLVPQAMAYALLAGLPPEVGLYAATVPLVAYAVFGTSRQLAVGPVAIVSLMTAAALGELADEGGADYIALAALLALMVGVVHLVLGLARLGFVVNLLSHSVLVGFTAAAALIIGTSQVKHVLGISVARKSHYYETVDEVITNISDTHGWTVLIGFGTVAALVALRMWRRSIPGALAVVVATTALSAAFDLESRGVAVVGDIPAQLPSFDVPDLAGGNIADLAVTAIVITLVGFMESIAVAKVYARRNRYDVDPNRELVGLGAANVAAGVFGGYPVTGGFSRTAVNADAGARTPMASLVTAGGVLLTLVLLTPLLGDLPTATLGAVVIVAVSGLFDVRELRHIASVKRSDLLTSTTAFVATLALGIELGILVAVGASLLVVFTRISNPHTAVIGRLPGTDVYRNVERFPEARTTPGIAFVRIDASLSFANVTFLKRRLRRIEDDAATPLRAIVIDASGINDIDASAESALRELHEEYRDRDVRLVFTQLKGPVRDVLHRGSLWEQLGDGALYATNAEAETALREEPDPHRPSQPGHSIGLDERG